MAFVNFHESFSALLPRLFLGVLFIAQGYDKAFRIKIRGVVDAFQAPAELHHVSRNLLQFSAWFTTTVELIGGLLILVGLFRYFAMYILGVDLLLVSIAFSLVNPIWDLKHIFPRLLLLILLLLMPPAWDVVSLDYWLGI